MKNFTFLILLLTLFSHTAFAFDHTHAAWTKLLQTHVKMLNNGTASKVDYKHIDKKELSSYLKSLEIVSYKEFKNFKTQDQVAFLINAYNAFTVKLIVDNYPVKSIKDLGSFWQNIWKKKLFTLLGEKRSLDDIEHNLTRNFKSRGTDARLHFAFNCASIGCPALLNEAWQSSKIKEQFNTAAHNFLKDHSRNRVNLKTSSVEISSIFKWYNGDFKTKNYKSLREFLKIHADSIAKNKEEKKFLLFNDFKIIYLKYNWMLNKL